MMKIIWTTSSLGIRSFPETWEIVPNPHRRLLTEEEALEFLTRENPEGMIAGVEPLTRRVLKCAPALKAISRCGVGLDSVDLDAAEELGIRVMNTPTAPLQSVAELTVALILGLLRNIAVLDARMKNGEWCRAKGYLVGGKTVAIIGCGRIGTRVAAILRSFGCTLIGYDPFLDSHPEIRLLDLESIWPAADIVSLHMPSTKDNYHFVDEIALSRMKETAVLINTARGALVDENALFSALNTGVIAGAGLDVFEEEPYSGPIKDLGDRVILTPHVASSAVEGRAAMENEALENLVGALNDKKK
jgi:D-3-phosphoglycerate dehydrogenase / 2-oxoglutarate reductase